MPRPFILPKCVVAHIVARSQGWKVIKFGKFTRHSRISRISLSRGRKFDKKYIGQFLKICPGVVRVRGDGNAWN